MAWQIITKHEPQSAPFTLRICTFNFLFPFYGRRLLLVGRDWFGLDRHISRHGIKIISMSALSKHFANKCHHLWMESAKWSCLNQRDSVPFQAWSVGAKLQCYSAFYKHWIVLCQTQCFMRSSGDLSVLHLMVSYKCWWFVCLCVWVCECLAGSRGAWGSAMPPTVVYLGLVHAPLGGVDPQGALPQHSSISGVC